jgi:hypothetical protein
MMASSMTARAIGQGMVTVTGRDGSSLAAIGTVAAGWRTTSVSVGACCGASTGASSSTLRKIIGLISFDQISRNEVLDVVWKTCLPREIDMLADVKECYSVVAGQVAAMGTLLNVQQGHRLACTGAPCIT